MQPTLRQAQSGWFAPLCEWVVTKMLRIILIILIILSWGGGILSFYDGYQNANMPTQFYFVFPLILIINVLCAKYLYSKSKKNKTEWALFGLLGNINALLIFWFWTFCVDRWRQGKSVFGDWSKCYSIERRRVIFNHITRRFTRAPFLWHFLLSCLWDRLFTFLDFISHTRRRVSFSLGGILKISTLYEEYAQQV
jgi:hypothetical protein